VQFDTYQTESFYDEMFEADGRPRPEARLLLETIQSLSDGELLRCKRAAERLLLQLGITFNVYGDTAGAERIFPFDILPRIIKAEEWDWIERGLRQRIHALNQFIDDIYHGQKILKDKVIPENVILSAASYRPQCQGLHPPSGVWCHITGTDLVRDSDGQFTCLRQLAGAVRRFLRAGEPRRAEADVPAGVRGTAGPPRVRLCEPACSRCSNRSRRKGYTGLAWSF
jgi:uncharacterized circularly permuted ATP-grasp superfamily protein